MKKFKRGDVREDGKVFWAYAKRCVNNEHWKTPDAFKKAQSRVAVTRIAFNNKEFETKEGHARKILTSIKYRAQSQNILFSLDIEALIKELPEKCPVLGIELSWCKRKGKSTDNSPSLDKFIPELGYIKGNVAWISFKANTIKSNASQSEVQAVANWMKQVKNQ